MDRLKLAEIRRRWEVGTGGKVPAAWLAWLELQGRGAEVDTAAALKATAAELQEAIRRVERARVDLWAELRKARRALAAPAAIPVD